ncbi:WG repeat-containing protein [Klebsiella huaxiensis]|nr:WG repeat-containing protein [Klebsiella huaxiensis]
MAPFSDESGQYGLIDKRGGWVVEPVYDLISRYDASGFCCAQR